MSAGTLYTFSGSGNSYKIRLLEKLIGIELKHEELDFLVRLITRMSKMSVRSDC